LRRNRGHTTRFDLIFELTNYILPMRKNAKKDECSETNRTLEILVLLCRHLGKAAKATRNATIKAAT